MLTPTISRILARRPLAILLAVTLASLTAQALATAPASAASGDITTIAGGNGPGASGDGGPATAAQLNNPSGVATDQSGDIFIADTSNNRVQEVDAAGTISTFAGDGTAGFSGDGGPAAAAQLNGPNSLALDSSGNLYIADLNNGRVRKVDHSTGIITTVAGNGGFSGPVGDGGPATSAPIDPEFLVATSTGLYITDVEHDSVRKVDSTGTITTFASGFGEPVGIAADDTGNLFVTDFAKNEVDKVDSAGNVTTVAGNGTAGYNGDGGPAAGAELNGPADVAVAGATLFISEYFNDVVRKVDPSGVITTVAGDGTFGDSGDGGPATAAQLANPFQIALNSSGDLLIADSGLSEIRSVEQAVTPDLLQLQGSETPNPDQVGQSLTYTLTITNPGTVSDATGVTLTDHLPVDATYVSAVPSQGTCNQSGGTVTCSLGHLAAGTTATVAIVVTPTSPVLLTNSAKVTAHQTDPDPGNNTLTLSDGATPASLRISFNNPSTPIAPAPFNLTATITNQGPNPATGVKLTLAIPAGLKVNSATPSAGACSVAQGTLTCPLGALAVNATDTVALNVTPTVSQAFLFNGTLDADQYNPLGTTAAATVTVGCGAVVTASVKFTADMGPCPGFGVVAAADNITVNLNGHHVSGAGTGAGYSTDDGVNAGVFIDLHFGVVVEGGTVSGFDAGVEIEAGGKNTVTNMMVTNNIGPDVTGARDDPLGINPDEITVGDGIVVGNSLLNTITNNRVIHNGPYDGIGVGGHDSNSNVIQGNTVEKTVAATNNSGGIGISVSAFFLGNEGRTPPVSHDNVLSNTVTGNAGDGISLQSDDNANVLTNLVSNNGGTATPGDGIDVAVLPGYGPTATQDTIRDNAITRSGQDGIQVSSDGNIIRNNSATDDNATAGQWFDLQDTNPNCGADKWTQNKYGAALFSPSCAGSSGKRVR